MSTPRIEKRTGERRGTIGATWGSFRGDRRVRERRGEPAKLTAAAPALADALRQIAEADDAHHIRTARAVARAALKAAGLT